MQLYTAIYDSSRACHKLFLLLTVQLSAWGSGRSRHTDGVRTYVHIHAVAMKHNYKPIGSLGVHVDSDFQWLHLCSIWSPMSHSHQMYTCNTVCMCSTGDGLCARPCNAALVTTPPVTCTETTHVWCLTAVWPPLPVHCVCSNEFDL